jgi:uncharacterized protein YjiS (DUF1127 family)
MSEQTNPIEPMSSHQLMRWARQERSALMAQYVRSAAFHLTSSLGSYLRYFAKLARRLSYELYLRNVTRTLQQFDEHILADIGLRRGEIEYAVRNGRSRLAARKTMAARRTPRHVALNVSHRVSDITPEIVTHYRLRRQT